MADPGFEIEGRFYPFVTSFRFGDTVLIKTVTGMDWHEFTEALDAHSQEVEALKAKGDEAAARLDPVVFLGVIAAAVWQGNPRWSRDRVLLYVEALEISGVHAVGGDDDVPPAGPPAAAELSSNGTAEEIGSGFAEPSPTPSVSPV